MTALPHAVAPSAVLADMKTVADCDATFDALTAFIAQTERQLSAAHRRFSNMPAGGSASLKAQLRIAKFTVPRIQERRADLKREERRRRNLGFTEIILALVKEHEPDAMRRVELIARELHPDLFTPEGVV